MAAVPEIGRCLNIREYGPTDFERVYEIDCAAFREGRRMTREKLYHHLNSPDGRALVAEDGGVLIGYALASLQGRSVGYLKVLAVTPGMQSRGIGGRLLAGIEAWLWDRGAQAVVLETACDETSARGFYEKNGYSVLETLARFYEDGGDAVRMLKDSDL
jgi:ribosomal-protein-alanine N-acetyltransferase